MLLILTWNYFFEIWKIDFYYIKLNKSFNFESLFFLLYIYFCYTFFKTYWMSLLLQLSWENGWFICNMFNSDSILQFIDEHSIELSKAFILWNCILFFYMFRYSMNFFKNLLCYFKWLFFIKDSTALKLLYKLCVSSLYSF